MISRSLPVPLHAGGVCHNLVATLLVCSRRQSFWIINEAELTDGTVATFLVASSLAFGHVGVRGSGPARKRPLRPFARRRGASCRRQHAVRNLALVWFLFRCRLVQLGWFLGLLVLLGFGNGGPMLLHNQSVSGRVADQ